MKSPIIALCLVLSPLAALVAEESSAKLTVDEAQNFKAAADYSKAARGVAMLVMRDGEVIFEDYAPIWNAAKPHLLASGTKGFIPVLAACAIQDRLITLDDKVSDTLVEWKDGGRKEQITIRQLLDMSSGIAGGDNPTSAPPYRKAVEAAEAVADPNTTFSFGPIPLQCFGALMSRKLEPKNETVYEYLDRRVLVPIGLRVGYWRRDSKDEMNMPSGAFLTAQEWAKFGELVRLRGSWNGRAVVLAGPLSHCMQPSAANPVYAGGWWKIGMDDEALALLVETKSTERQRKELAERKALGFHVPRDTIAALGKGGQGCYVIPSRKMVIVRLGDSDGREFTDNQFIAKLLGKSFARAVNAK